MNRKSLAIIVLLALAVGIGWMLLRSSVYSEPSLTGDRLVELNLPSESQNGAAEIELSQGSVPTVAEDHFMPDQTPQEISTDFAKATSAAEAFDAVEAAFLMGNKDLGIWTETKLYMYCHSVTNMNTAPHIKTSWAFEGLQEYCANYQPSMSNRYLTSVGDGPPLLITEKQSIDRQLNGLSPEEQKEFLFEYLATAQATYEISAAFMLMEELVKKNQEPILGLGQNLDVSIHDYLEVQEAVGFMLQCKFNGGCEPGSAQMLSICAVSTTCYEWWGIEDYFANTLSPIKYEQLLKILEQLKSG